MEINAQRQIKEQADADSKSEFERCRLPSVHVSQVYPWLPGLERELQEKLAIISDHKKRIQALKDQDFGPLLTGKKLKGCLAQKAELEKKRKNSSRTPNTKRRKNK